MSGTEAPKGIDVAKVTHWYTEHISATTPPLCFSLIAGGQSNLTYVVIDAAGNRSVLRRPPLGAVLATAHDMAREHRIISALGPTAVPVPQALGLCDDAEVNGAPFYVMAHVDGHVLHTADDARAVLDESRRRALGAAAADVLAALHRLDPDDVGLGDLGRKEAYLERQLKRWRTQWEKSKTRELRLMDEVYEALSTRIPPQLGSTIVHGDYRFGNMLVTPAGGIAAVLDWELCTLGDPLADVGYVLNDWVEPGEESNDLIPKPTTAGGFPTKREFLARYARLTGRDVSRVGYYRAFQAWRLAAIVEGVLARYLKGVMGQSVDTEPMRRGVEQLAEQAKRLLT